MREDLTLQLRYSLYQQSISLPSYLDDCNNLAGPAFLPTPAYINTALSAGLRCRMERAALQGRQRNDMHRQHDFAGIGYAAMQAKLHDFEFARAARLRVSEDRNSHIVAHCLLACSVQVVTNSVAPSWIFAPDADGGKPRLLIESQTLYASLSHPRGAVAVAISRVADVGVDVKAIAPIDELDQVAERVLTHREPRAVSASDHPIETFIQLWTRKEALAKAFGLGLRAPFSSIDVLDRTAPRLPSELLGPTALSDASCSGPHRGSK